MERLNFQLFMAKSYFDGCGAAVGTPVWGVLRVCAMAFGIGHPVANFTRHGPKTTITETNDDQ
jgi:hypothetical protein